MVESTPKPIPMRDFINIEEKSDGMSFRWSVSDDGKKARIDNFRLREEHRGEGAGTMILTLFKDYLRSHEVESISARVVAFDKASPIHLLKRFYEKNGFEVIKDPLTGEHLAIINL